MGRRCLYLGLPPTVQRLRYLFNMSGMKPRDLIPSSTELACIFHNAKPEQLPVTLQRQLRDRDPELRWLKAELWHDERDRRNPIRYVLERPYLFLPDKLFEVSTKAIATEVEKIQSFATDLSENIDRCRQRLFQAELKWLQERGLDPAITDSFNKIVTAGLNAEPRLRI